MSKASRWTIVTRFGEGENAYSRKNNLAVIMHRLGIGDDLGEAETPEVQSIISTLAEYVSRENPCMVEAHHDGALLLASVDHRQGVEAPPIAG